MLEWESHIDSIVFVPTNLFKFTTVILIIILP